ncbi:MAG: hypothetical protein ACXV5Q_15640 [Frankiaceae bacterium]
MSALLTERPYGSVATASPSAEELTVVLARIRARCRPDLAVTSAQRIEALLGVLEASRADLRAARSGAAGWLGLGSTAFLVSADRAQAELGQAAETIQAGAAALRTYSDVAQICLDRSRDIEHRLLVARDDRSRRLAGEATGAPARPAGSAVAPDQAFDLAADDLLRAARLVLAEAEAAIAALVARLGQLTGASRLCADVPTPAPGAGPAGDSGGFDNSIWGVMWKAHGGADSAATVWNGAKTLSMFAAYARAPQGAAQTLAEARYVAALQPFLGVAGRATLPLSVAHNAADVITPSHPGARGWGDRAAGLAGAAGGATLLLTSAGLIAFGPVGAAVAVGGLVVASAWQLGNLVYDHRQELRDGMATAWHGIERGGEVAVSTLRQWGSAAVHGIEETGSGALDTLGDVGSTAMHGLEDAGGALVDGAAGFGRGLLRGIGLG